MQRRASLTLVALAGCLAAALPSIGWAGCGCDKPAPPRASIRPFVAAPTQTVTLFNAALTDAATYDVAFEPQGGAQHLVLRREIGRGRSVPCVTVEGIHRCLSCATSVGVIAIDNVFPFQINIYR